MTDDEKMREALPARDATKAANEQGLFRKFDIRRTDGSDQPGGKHEGCDYFVLDVTHDPYAIPALGAYAKACATTHPELALSMMKRYEPAQHRDASCNVPFGSYENTIALPRPKHMYPTERGDWITVDRCVMDEVLSLWREGIWTLGGCCRHTRGGGGYIAVAPEYKKVMIDLGYNYADHESECVFESKSDCRKPDKEPHKDVVKRVEWWQKQYKKFYEGGAEKLADCGIIVDDLEVHMKAIFYMESVALSLPRQDKELEEVQGLLVSFKECLDWMERLRASGDSGFWEWPEDSEYKRGVRVLNNFSKED